MTTTAPSTSILAQPSPGAPLVPSGVAERLDVASLRKAIFAKRLPEPEKWRASYGKNVDMNLIRDAIRQAEFGVMVDLCDIESECIAMDPHILGLSGKRFGAMARVEWDLTPAQGAGLDKARALEVCETVRQHLRLMRGFKRALVDLMWALFDGRALMEIDWYLERGARAPWRPLQLEWVHPRRLAFGPDRELRVINTWTRVGFFARQGVAIRDMPGKFVSWTPRRFREYPEREGLGPRSLYWSFFKRFSARLRMIWTELFAIPWRIVHAGADTMDRLNKEDVEDAADAVEALGEETTAALAPGLELDVVFPATGDAKGELFGMTIDQVDKQMSKLWIGGTATMDAAPGGMNGDTTDGHKQEQNLFLEVDAIDLAERVQVDLIDVDVLLNFGPADLPYSPTFTLKAAPSEDRGKQQERLNKAISIGVPVALAEYYEDTGIRPPEPTESVLLVVDSGGGGLLGGGSARARIIDPTAQPAEGAAGQAGADAAGGVQTSAGATTPVPSLDLSPTDVAAFITVNEARASKGLPPLTFPDGRLQPDGFLTVAEFKAKHASTIATGAAAVKGEDPTGAKTPPAPASPAPPAAGSATPPPGAPKPPPAPAAQGVDAGPPSDAPGAPSSSPPAGPPSSQPEGAPSSQLPGEPSSRGAAALDHPPPAPAPGVLPTPAPAAARELEEPAPATQRSARVPAPGPKSEPAPSADPASDATPPEPPGAEVYAPPSSGTTPAARAARAAEALLGLEATARKKQPGFANGSPEVIIERGVREGARLTNAWAEELARAVDGQGDDERVLYARIKSAAAGLPLDKVAASVERTIVRALMLGALDAAWEAEADQPVKLPILSERSRILLAGFGAPIGDFVTKPFTEAINTFLGKQVMTRRAFDRLRAEAKRRAFTVAGLARDDMLATAHAELTKAIADGTSMRSFVKQLAERFDSAGWTQLNPSHAELVYRNATMGAYASGRDAQMRQPEVLAARPYWQVLGVDDSVTRETHAKAHKKVLRADDPFWGKAPLPWGHNCRCRKVSRSADDLKRLGLTVTSGAELSGLPDEGWDGGGNIG